MNDEKNLFFLEHKKTNNLFSLNAFKLKTSILKWKNHQKSENDKP